MITIRGLVLALVLSSTAFHAAANPQPAGLPDRFTLFESGQVRPLAMSDDGKYLFAVNTPDNRLEVLRVKNNAAKPLVRIGSVQVGLEPVAVAIRGNEAWVVNHLSDSISIVKIQNPRRPRVVHTLLVGDEPRDIVFAGPNRGRAFITAAHRGQNAPFDPQLMTPGVGRADVWVFDADDPGTAPLTIVNLFSDTPRALAVSPDGATVYAAAFHSGNRTTVVNDVLVTNGGVNAPDGMGLPGPNTNFEGHEQPETALIVRYDGTNWVDELGRSWDNMIRFDLPDKDVFAIDAGADPPVQVAGPSGFFAGVGTVLFNMAVNPATGKVYVANTEARNEVRFEGPGDFAGQTVRGHVDETRITVLDGSSVTPRHLNKHVDFDQCCDPTPNPVSDRSLAIPLGMTVSGDGNTLYLAAFGSSKIGIFSTAELESDTFTPNPADHVELSGGGPTGVVLDEGRDRLYVLTRFDNSISVVDTAGQQEIEHLALFNPEPASVVDGRPFLYDARNSSSNGTMACASCHVFGDLDSLGWDLGAPDEEAIENPGPFAALPFLPDPALEDFQPLKGPMTTQSLRGMDNHGPMHWRGDRTGANDVPDSVQPDTGAFDEDAAFKKFNGAFVGLNGRNAQLTPQEMQQFTDFVLQLTYPPNPIRNLDNSLTEEQQRGLDHMLTPASAALPSFEIKACMDCHVTDLQGNAEFGVERPGFFGTDGRLALTGEDFLTPENGTDVQALKVPHFRNLYQKVGMFGIPNLPVSVPGDDSHQGDQIRGFGYLHDGAMPTIRDFISVVGFAQPVAPAGFAVGPQGEVEKREVEAFLLAFDSNLAPIVGQQVTLDDDNGTEVGGRIDLLTARADAGECELVATSRQRGFERGYLYLVGSGSFRSSDLDEGDLDGDELRALAGHRPITYTCVPPGSGYRLALDADLDGCFDVTETKIGSDPRDATDVPSDCSSSDDEDDDSDSDSDSDSDDDDSDSDG